MTSTKPPRAFAQVPAHHRIEHLLGERLIARLLAQAAAQEPAFTSAKIGTSGGGRTDEAIRTSRASRDFGDLRPELEERFAAVLPEAQQALGIVPVRLARLEMQLVAHGDGAFYKRHIDTGATPGADSYRALTGVYYFHRLPRAFSGGDLRLHPIMNPEGVERYADIPPDNDSFVLFAAWAPHEVRPISCPSKEWLDSRFAINCWYWTRRGP